MQTLKKYLHIILAVIISVAFIIPANISYANDDTSKELYVSNKLSSGKVSLHGTITAFEESAATPTSITLTWADSADNYTYDIYATFYKNGKKKSEESFLNISGYTYTFSNLSNGTYANITIYPAGTLDSDNYATITSARTLPKAVKNVSTKFGSGNKLYIKWYAAKDAELYTTSGYKLYLYSTQGKRLKTYKTTTSLEKTLSATKIKNCYKVIIRPYIKIGSKVLYGSKKTIYAVPQPTITTANTSSRTDISKEKIILRWKNINDADKYVIYVARNASTQASGLTYTKLGTSSTNKYTFTKYKGKTIDASSYYYHFYIITKATVSGKSRKSSAVYGFYVHL